MPLKIAVYGEERISGKFGAIARKFGFLEDATMQAVLYVHSKMPPYPPQKAGSTYRRTGTLGRTITSLMGHAPDALSRVENKFGQVRGIVGTKLSYAPWVIDQNRQTKSHKQNGWYTLQGVVRSLRAGIKSTYKNALSTFLRREF
jgi:hypothetical protein